MIATKLLTIMNCKTARIHHVNQYIYDELSQMFLVVTLCLEKILFFTFKFFRGLMFLFGPSLLNNILINIC